MTIVCDGKDEQPIQCYRLVGEGAKELAVGDEIAVFGTIKNYKGTIEFDKGCVLVPVDSVASVKSCDRCLCAGGRRRHDLRDPPSPAWSSPSLLRGATSTRISP